ncbi:MAG: DUF4139 domain-containing protein [Treponema sp.]|jgi:hypothetical protein|nr:DUF4139 domain-containing protein [Treponema sp.]
MKKIVLCLAVCCFCALGISAQAIRDYDETAEPQSLPVTKITVFSSGLAYFEHTGTLNGPAVIKLPFRENAVNDALKSLVINDPSSANPAVSYRFPHTLFQTLRSLKIDLSNEADMAGILRKLRGAEVEIAAPSPISGKILGVEYRSRQLPSGNEAHDPWLSLYTGQGIKMFNFAEIISIVFKDPAIESDLKRALDLLAASGNNDSRDLTISLPGNGSRGVSLNYVIPAPVWKASYRLDLGGGNARPRFQGWAIVDNDGDTDWDRVELSLAAGRPASFIQDLYPPYYISRPVLPLAIAGAAGAVTHDQGWSGQGYNGMAYAPVPAPESQARASMSSAKEMMQEADSSYRERPAAAGVIDTQLSGAAAFAAGEQFEFTIKSKVSVARQMSAMLPLADAFVEARKLLIFSGAGPVNKNQNPRLGAELTNTSGLKLPAGPITVYDGGTYAGDALIEFWNEGEKRLISYGEDLSVTGAVTNSSSNTFSSVAISGGVMTITRRQEFLKTYTFKNNAAQEKRLIIEHPKNQGTALDSPAADEETPTAYRFTVTLPAAGLSVNVRESRPIMERVSLLQLRPDVFLSYTSGQELPANVREALQQAVNLRSAANASQAAVTEAERQRSALVSEQDRIRKNLEAAGGQTQQGQEYLKRLLSLDDSIDKLDTELQRLRENAKTTQKAYEDYLNSLKL